MTHSCFLSLIIPVAQAIPQQALEQLIVDISQESAEKFSDYEIVIVDNRTEIDFSNLTLPEQTRNNCYIVRLAAPVVWDNVVLAGLERANGDFALTFDPALRDSANQLDNLYRLAQYGHDITYLRASMAVGDFRRRLFYRLLGALGSIHVDPRALGCYLMSRRAVNAIVSNWSSNSFLGGAVFGGGFVPAAIDISKTTRTLRRTSRQSHNTAWAALTRSAGLPLLIGQLAVLSMAAASSLSAINALLVRVFGVNILGQAEAYVPGWAFVVILVSFGFLVTNIALYTILRFLYVLLDESGKAPFYTVQRYSRIS